MKIFNTKLVITGLFILLLMNCEESITTPDVPRVNLNIVVKDSSGFYFDFAGKQDLDSAKVYINSISYNKYYSEYTNTSGSVLLSSILPDRYNITVSKKVQYVSETGSVMEKLFNGKILDIPLYESELADTVYVILSNSSKLVISELYYSGAPPGPNRIPTYYHDQFTEIYNNSNETVYLDSLIIADLDAGHRGEEYIYCVHAYMFPGTGTDYPLDPGEFVVVAQDAIKHTDAVPASVDLTNADFEYYVSDKPDVDNPEVTDMVRLHHKYGNDVLYSVFNDAVVLVRAKDPFEWGYSNFDCLLIPVDKVLDGVEYRDNLAEVDFKRVDESIDGGITGGIQSYSSKSVQRQIDVIRDDRIILMDNNNSSIDFVVLNHPTPGYLSD